MKIIVISQGDYSDYGFGPVLIAPEGRRLDDDHANFLLLFRGLRDELPDIGPMPRFRPRAIRRAWEARNEERLALYQTLFAAKIALVKKDLGLPDDGEECFSDIFGAYLEKLGYRKADVLEVNVGSYGKLDFEAKVE